MLPGAGRLFPMRPGASNLREVCDLLITLPFTRGERNRGGGNINARRAAFSSLSANERASSTVMGISRLSWRLRANGIFWPGMGMGEWVGGGAYKRLSAPGAWTRFRGDRVASAREAVGRTA